MAVNSPSTQLGCGRDIDEVWDGIGQPPDRHERTCPFCQAARSDLEELARATRTLRDDDSADAGLGAGPEVIGRILSVARSEVRRGRRLPLDAPQAGRAASLTISEQALVAVVRRTGDATREVQIRRCSVSLDPGPERPAGDGDAAGPGVPETVPAGAEGVSPLLDRATDVRVSLKVSVGYGAAVVVAVDRLRAAVIGAVAREVGMNVVSVDVVVEDLHDA